MCGLPTILRRRVRIKSIRNRLNYKCRPAAAFDIPDIFKSATADFLKRLYSVYELQTPYEYMLLIRFFDSPIFPARPICKLVACDLTTLVTMELMSNALTYFYLTENLKQWKGKHVCF